MGTSKKVGIWFVAILANAGLMAFIQPPAALNIIWSAVFGMVLTMLLIAA